MNGTLDYEKRRKYLEREIECHFENLKEAVKEGLTKSKFNSFKSSIKQSLKTLSELDKAVFKENFKNNSSWIARLNTEKKKRRARLISILKGENNASQR